MRCGRVPLQCLSDGVHNYVGCARRAPVPRATGTRAERYRSALRRPAIFARNFVEPAAGDGRLIVLLRFELDQLHARHVRIFSGEFIERPDACAR